MSNLLYSHNIDLQDFVDQDYAALYQQRRRDANFAAAIQHGDTIHALRDHLGIAPLFYRFDDDGVRFSAQLADLVKPTDTINPEGVRAFTQLSSTRLVPLFIEIHIVPAATVIEVDPINQTHRTIYTYPVQPDAIASNTAWDELVEQFKQLMIHSLENQLQGESVGLYLSGGIDSALIGIFLKQLGVEIKAYTSGAWGESSSDVIYAKKNAEIIGIDHHEIHYLETTDYDSAMSALPAKFGLPHGTPTGLGVIKLWEHTSIGEQQQLFFGQNCDTIMACVEAQALCYFLQPLPTIVRKRLHSALIHTTAVENYIHLARNYQHDLSTLAIPQTPDSLTQLQKIITAGMYIGQTPSSSEVFTQPSFVCGQSIINPYHNMDLVEFVMGLPINKRLAFNSGRKFMPTFEKHLIQKLASHYLPEDIVSRKKAFIVSFDRDQRSKALYDGLATSLFDIPLTKSNERFGGEILRRWLELINYEVKA